MLLADRLTGENRRLVDRAGPKIDVTNVAEYYFHHDEEFWTLDQFEGSKPLFDSCWVEYRYPREVRSIAEGVHRVGAYDRGQVPYFGCLVKALSNGYFDLTGSLYYVHAKGIDLGVSSSIQFHLSDDGKPDEYRVPKWMGDDDQARATLAQYLHPILLAFSFANCSNVETVEVTAPAKLQRARIRREKMPLVSYRVINILPLSKAKSGPRVRTVESDGQGVALHIRRGHFAHYGPKYGRGKLFGRLEGQFWIPQAAVGSLDAGVSVHDYAVAAKREP